MHQDRTEFESLYRRSANGIEQWKIKVDNSILGPYATIIIQHGQFKGKQTRQDKTIYKGKNIGKSNETKYYKQALLEAEADFLKKKNRQGYKSLYDLGFTEQENEFGEIFGTKDSIVYNLEDCLKELPLVGITEPDFRLPMKAYPMYDNKKKLKVKFPRYGQPKLNGVRATLSIVDGKPKLQSKTGLEYKIAHILQPLQEALELTNLEVEFFNWLGHELVFDGELYIHNQPLQEIVSAVRVPSLLSQTIVFNVFDLAVPIYNQKQRLEILARLSKKIKFSDFGLALVKSSTINNEIEANDYTQEQIKLGYEGAMFRAPFALYSFGKRTYDIVKNKVIQDAEFIIVDIVDTRDAPGLAMLVCKNDINDETFKVVPQGTHAQRQVIFANRNKYLGKQVTVSFYERTVDGIPFHTTAIIRDYE